MMTLKMTRSKVWLTLALMVGACSTSGGSSGTSEGPGSPEPSPGGGPTKVAGGQSGSDSEGSYYCDLSHATSADVPLDVRVVPDNPNANTCTASTSLVGAFPLKRTVDCGELGDFHVEVAAPTAARRLTGVTSTDTSNEGGALAAEQACYAMSIDADIHIASADGSIVLDSSNFLTDAGCWYSDVAGYTHDAKGRPVAFGLESGTYFALHVAFREAALSTAGEMGDVVCREKRPLPVTPVVTPSVGGASPEGGAGGVEAEPLSGGAAGAGASGADGGARQ